MFGARFSLQRSVSPVPINSSTSRACPAQAGRAPGLSAGSFARRLPERAWNTSTHKACVKRWPFLVSRSVCRPNSARHGARISGTRRADHVHQLRDLASRPAAGSHAKNCAAGHSDQPERATGAGGLAADVGAVSVLRAWRKASAGEGPQHTKARPAATWVAAAPLHETSVRLQSALRGAC